MDGWRRACESLGLKLSGTMTPSQGSRTLSRLHHASFNSFHNLTSPPLQFIVALTRHYLYYAVYLAFTFFY